MFLSRASHTKLKLLQIVFLFLTFSLLSISSVNAKQYSFIVQPILKPSVTSRFYQPLVQYLQNKTGHTFKIVTSKSFISYWPKMIRGEYDLILDAAHFTDYRIKNMKYTVLAKIPDTVTFSLITHENQSVLDHNDLIGQDVVTLPPPSLGSVRLAQMFPNPMRQPHISSVDSAIDAINNVKSKKIFAALIPTPLLNKHRDVHTVGTTRAVPHMAISASPKIDKTVQKKIRSALLKASNTEEGRSMLKKLNLSSFQKTSAKTYRGYEKLLSGVWGY